GLPRHDSKHRNLAVGVADIARQEIEVEGTVGAAQIPLDLRQAEHADPVAIRAFGDLRTQLRDAQQVMRVGATGDALPDAFVGEISLDDWCHGSVPSKN